MSNNKIFFSVVIPLYNKRPHIQRSVFSVLNQSYENFELIVVDDGSTDGSLDELQDINDKRLKIFEKENGGVSSARNYGIKKATSDYVAFLDADDEWDIAFLETIVQMYELYPNGGIFTTGCRIVSSDSQRVSCIKHINNIFKLKNYFKEFVNLSAPINNSSTSVVKKESLFKVGLFSENLKNYEDLNVWFKIALIDDVIYSKKILASIYINSVNRSSVNINVYHLLKSYSSLTTDIEDFIMNQKLDKGDIDLVFQKGTIGIMRQAIKARNWAFFETFKKSELYRYINTYHKIVYLTRLNRLGLIAYKILNILGLKK
jgi:glycosyltransferase involved in cell wall biosynthesis